MAKKCFTLSIFSDRTRHEDYKPKQGLFVRASVTHHLEKIYLHEMVPMILFRCGQYLKGQQPLGTKNVKKALFVFKQIWLKELLPNQYMLAIGGTKWVKPFREMRYEYNEFTENHNNAYAWRLLYAFFNLIHSTLVLSMAKLIFSTWLKDVLAELSTSLDCLYAISICDWISLRVRPTS